MLRGAPDADVVLMAHVGLEGLARVSNAARQIPLRAPVRVQLRRIPRSELPGESELPAWLDDRFVEMDAWIGASERAREPEVAGVGQPVTEHATKADVS